MQTDDHHQLGVWRRPQSEVAGTKILLSMNGISHYVSHDLQDGDCYMEHMRWPQPTVSLASCKTRVLNQSQPFVNVTAEPLQQQHVP